MITLCYTDLIREFCTAVNLQEPEKLARGAIFTVNDVIFGFRQPSTRSSDTLLLFADFGPIPKADEAAVYSRILRENYLEFFTKNASFCVSSVTGNVVYAQALSLAVSSGQELTTTVEKLAERARVWRLDHADGRLMVNAAPVRRPALNLPPLGKACPL